MRNIGKKRGQAFQYLVLWLLLAAVVGGIWYLGGGMEPGSEAASVPKPPSAATAAPSASPAPSQTPAAVKEEGKMRGIWVSYMALQSDSAQGFQENYRNIVAQAKEAGMTALFVHVRPFSDALYPSEIYPWSHLVTGAQGADPGFDPLSFMIEETHGAGMEFHAWINPMRVKLSQTPAELSEDNPYQKLKESNPYYFLETESGIYLNPAYSEVREMISGGVKEIVDNYQVDGVHFDDYFYPSDMDQQDELAYFAYNESADTPLSLEDWRIANVNAMISQVYLAVKSSDSSVVFGISPQGNLSNNVNLGADVREWCRTRGYIDYICPQLYYSYENPALGYTEALNEWNEMEKYDGLGVYIGLALYKVGSDSDEGTWPGDGSIITKQIADAEESGADGIVLFDISCLDKWEG